MREANKMEQVIISVFPAKEKTKLTVRFAFLSTCKQSFRSNLSFWISKKLRFTGYGIQETRVYIYCTSTLPPR